MKKGDTVTYVPAWARRFGKPVIEARVRRVHRDGSVSIEATFVRGDNGEVVPGYLGIRQRVAAEILSEEA